MTTTDEERAQMRDIVARYPQPRSAVMPLLHLAQSRDGAVTAPAIDDIAELLGMSRAEVSGVASFYTMYLRQVGGKFRVGVCINSLCAILGGDEIWESLVDYVGVGNLETTDDGLVSLERIECQAACTHAPVMTLNWEFLDNQTPTSARDIVDRIRAGEPVASTRGPQVIPQIDAVGRSLAGVDDLLNDTDNGLDDLTLAGLTLAKQLGHTVPAQGGRAATDEGA
jgi:NADH-quinone oxidoreductase subunit E